MVSNSEMYLVPIHIGAAVPQKLPLQIRTMRSKKKKKKKIGNFRTMFEICSRCLYRRSDVFNFEQISHVVLVFDLEQVNTEIPTGL